MTEGDCEYAFIWLNYDNNSVLDHHYK